MITADIRVELVVIGDELLAGTIKDTNVAYLSRHLLGLGLGVKRVTVTGDDEEELAQALSQTLERSDIVISCGGLGPTDDDLTRQVAAQLFETELCTDEKLLSWMKERYERRGIKLSELGAKQADVPRGAKLFLNPVGAAPAIVLTRKDKTLILLPGVPAEVQAITKRSLLPYLSHRFPRTTPRIILLRTAGTTETELASRIAPVIKRFPGLKVGYLPRRGTVDLRVEDITSDRVESVLEAFTEILDEDLYANDKKELEEVVGEILVNRSHTLAVAESCTGGMLGARIVNVPGSSEYFLGGVVAYADKVKEGLLGVSRDLIVDFGAVSEEVAEAMARGVRDRFDSTYGIGITGIAGPGGGSLEKPVGLVYIGLATCDKVEVWRFDFPGPRYAVRERSVIKALDLLRRLIIESD